jgi:hypothetical protein
VYPGTDVSIRNETVVHGLSAVASANTSIFHGDGCLEVNIEPVCPGDMTSIRATTVAWAGLRLEATL